MTRAPLRSLSAALLLALTGALTAACAGAEAPAAPAPDASHAASAAVEPSPSPAASDAARDAVVAKPARPAAMEKMDAEGAAAAAEYFLSLRSYIMKTGDTAEWESMSHKACDFCKAGRDQARQIAKRHDVFAGGEIEADVIETYMRDELTGIWPLDVRMAESATTVTAPDGSVLLNAAATVEVNRVEVGIVDGHWVVVSVASSPQG